MIDPVLAQAITASIAARQRDKEVQAQQAMRQQELAMLYEDKQYDRALSERDYQLRRQEFEEGNKFAKVSQMTGLISEYDKMKTGIEQGEQGYEDQEYQRTIAELNKQFNNAFDDGGELDNTWKDNLALSINAGGNALGLLGLFGLGKSAVGGYRKATKGIGRLKKQKSQSALKAGIKGASLGARANLVGLGLTALGTGVEIADQFIDYDYEKKDYLKRQIQAWQQGNITESELYGDDKFRNYTRDLGAENMMRNISKLVQLSEGRRIGVDNLNSIQMERKQRTLEPLERYIQGNMPN